MVHHPLWGIMHWFKLLVEAWILFGLAMVIWGLLWSSNLANESQPTVSKNTPAVPQSKFSANDLNKARSA
jgi:hypothetical protein